MTAIPLYSNIEYTPKSFETFLTTEFNPFELDLKNATLILVLQQCDKYKKIKGSVSTISSLIFNIKEIEDEYGVTLSPSKITDMFYAYFVQFLFSKGCKPSTINTYCNLLKAALKWATKHNCTVSSTYDEYKPIHDVSDKIALSPDEISHIYHFDINKLQCRPQHKRTLEKVRDMFVLSCNLGLRHSDMVRIEPTHFNDTKTKFTIILLKTKNKAVVDLTSMVIDKNVTRNILEKYNYTAPYVGHISAYNRYLHELVKLIGEEFDKEKIYEYKCNGEMETITNKRWELITSHTARRTFITYHILRGVPEVKVRRCSGHTDSRSFNKYVRFDENE